MFQMITKMGSAVGSVGTVVADTLEGTIELGSKAKNAIGGEISSLQYERDMENAVNRILVKTEHIKQIMKALNISSVEAEELLLKEMNHGKNH